MPKFEHGGRTYENVPRRLAERAAAHGYTVFGKVVSGMDVVQDQGHAHWHPGGPFPATPKTVVISSATLVK